MRRICCPLECGSLQVVAATRHTRSSINRFIDRARVGDAGRRLPPPPPPGRRGARNRRRTRVGEGGLELVLGVGLGLGEILVMGLGLGEILVMDLGLGEILVMIFQPFCIRRISIY